jgi:hypothetical protein
MRLDTREGCAPRTYARLPGQDIAALRCHIGSVSVNSSSPTDGGNASGGTIGPVTLGAIYNETGSGSIATGVSTNTLLMLAAAAAAIWFFFLRKK